MRSATPIVLLALMLPACQPGATPPAAPPAGGARDRASAPAASPRVLTPAEAASRPAALLAQPSGDSVRLAGNVRLDAGFFARTAAGTGLEWANGKVLAAGVDLAVVEPGGLVSKTRLRGSDGAPLVSKTRFLEPDGTPVTANIPVLGSDGKPIVSKTRLLDADRRPVAEEFGNVISDDAETLLSDQGGSLLADLGDSLISNHGGSLLGKAKWRVADASGHLASSARFALRNADVKIFGGDEAPALGVQLPAAGMRVGVLSLRSGKLLPIGVGPDGKPVYAAYSNLAGEFEFYLPKEEAGNVMLVAQVPRVSDGRARYVALTAVASEADAVLDEDTALLARTVHQVFASRLAEIFVQDPTRMLCLLDHSDNMPPELVALIRSVLEQMQATARQAGVSAASGEAEARFMLASRVADVILASVELDKILVPSVGDPARIPPQTANRPAMQVLSEVLKEGREAAAVKLQQNPAYFDDQPYFKQANACAPGRYAIFKPSDVPDFVVTEYVANNSDPGLLFAADVFRSLGLPTTSAGHPVAVSRLTRAMDAILGNLLLAYMADVGGSRAVVQGLFDAYDPKARLPQGSLLKPGLVPCPRGGSGFADGKCGP